MHKIMTILKASPQTGIQDGGRFGFAHLGITQGGVADEYSYHWANKLLGNPFASAVIEVTLGGFEAVIHQDTHIAITGATSPVLLDEVVTSTWRCIKVKKGQHLSIPLPRNGLRHYIALPGGIDAPTHHRSLATVHKEGLGGLQSNGDHLTKGDLIYARLPDANNAKQVAVAARYIPKFKPSHSTNLNVILGSQYRTFSPQALDELFHSQYCVGTQSNKMGYQMSGNAVDSPKQHLISEAISLGAIQIPPNGQPIIMLCERQTIGGYPKVGNVARMDLGKLTQLKPGAKVNFVKSDVDKCMLEYTQWLRFFQNTTS
ncbi:5-oxoprolinase/urea amidolyase family protein [Vibrio sp. B1Z05]|nr:5-oxoprolinase/urea amidolyase family protein [Vibrio sp. B1Z05]